jgi:lipopolysaccharide transport system ATP-binding protein
MKATIAVQELSKLYRLGESQRNGYHTLREAMSGAFAGPWNRLRPSSRRAPQVPDGRTERQQLWALHDVSFDVAPGEAIGIIGRNGAGKSTLLKILSRITEPTSGRAILTGRLGSLLEVGTGFHTELTGRQNIYLNGAICGMTRREISRKFDDIVAFAELERFLDTPVKRYSSGMFVRLAFAVASHMEPDILLVDEVLAVGDAAFQKKCLGRMGEVSRSGRTVLFVSHNMATIVNLCQRVALLEKGRLAYLGNCEDGIRRYLSDLGTAEGAAVDLAEHPNRRQGYTPILGKMRLLDGAGKETTQFLCGGPMAVELSVIPDCPVREPHFAIGYEDPLGCRLFTVATYLSKEMKESLRATGRLVCHIDELPLAPGRYCLSVNAGPKHAVWSDFIDQAAWFDVLATDFYGNGRTPNPDWGRVLMRSTWRSSPPS